MSDEQTACPPDQAEDLNLVRRSQTGDAAAFEALVRNYHGRIYGLIYHMTGNREEAEKQTQQIFVKAWKALGHFREQVSFYIWIYRIALNNTLSFRQRRTRRKTGSLDDFHADVKTSQLYRDFSSKGAVLRKMSLSEFQQKMNGALQTLPLKHRASVILHEVQGMPQAEIAHIMRCSERRVRSRLASAHRRLQAELAEFVK
jgi:RNA polymerase sigma-70 factor (ECF subfamily)